MGPVAHTPQPGMVGLRLTVPVRLMRRSSGTWPGSSDRIGVRPSFFIQNEAWYHPPRHAPASHASRLPGSQRPHQRGQPREGFRPASHGRGSDRPATGGVQTGQLGSGSGAHPAPGGDPAAGDDDSAGRAGRAGPDRVRPGGQVRIDGRIPGPGGQVPGPDPRVRPPAPWSSRLISISRPSMSAGVNMTRAPTSAPSSRTTVPGPDGPAADSVITCSKAKPPAGLVRWPGRGRMAVRTARCSRCTEVPGRGTGRAVTR